MVSHRAVCGHGERCGCTIAKQEILLHPRPCFVSPCFLSVRCARGGTQVGHPGREECRARNERGRCGSWWRGLGTFVRLAFEPAIATRSVFMRMRGRFLRGFFPAAPMTNWGSPWRWLKLSPGSPSALRTVGGVRPGCKPSAGGHLSSEGHAVVRYPARSAKHPPPWRNGGVENALLLGNRSPIEF